MSGSGTRQALVFLGLPDLKKLCCVTVSLQEDEDPRSRQMEICRELVLLYSDILACPALDSFTEITVVMAIPFFQRGVLQAFGQRRHLQLGSPRCVFPGLLQCCLSYSLIARLAPSWNKAGLHLIRGRNFLTDSGRLSAISMELTTSQGQLCISIEGSTVRLPPTTLQDFDLPPLVLRKFCNDPNAVLNPSSTRHIWCHVLPSMKKGQIITISRQLPIDGPFRTYRDLQNHWNRLYGYRLPELAEEDVVFCSIYFRPVGERLFTYPLSCIRLQPLQLCSQLHLQGVLASFLSDIRGQLQNVCGFPARLTGQPCYHTVSLNANASLQVNLTISSSITPDVTQLPGPPPPQTPKPSAGSQPAALAPLCQQAAAQGLLGNGCGFWGSQGGFKGGGDRPSLSSSFSSSIPFLQTASSLLSSSCSSSSLPLLQPASSLFSSSSSSSSSLPLFQPASSLFSSSSSSLPLLQPTSSLLSSSSFSRSSSSFPLLQPASSVPSSLSLLPSLPPPSQPPVDSNPKLVPILKNKCPSRHINVALLHVQKQKLSSRGGEPRRVTPPAVLVRRPASSSAFSLSSFPAPLSPSIPHFSHCPDRPTCSVPQPLASSKFKRITSLSPAWKPRPRLLLTSQQGTKLKPSFSCKTNQRLHVNSSPSPAAKSCSTTQDRAASAPGPLTSSDTSRGSRARVTFESKSKKSRRVIADRDVEEMARSNQLSQLTSATLLAWLRGRRVLVSAKHRKEELMLKVMSCLAEA